MKKTLLLIAALASSTLAGVAQTTETDITPSGYKWGETGVLPTISTNFVQAPNPTAPAFDAYGGADQYNNGLIGIDGNAANTYACVTSGMSIVDLGGEVGKVFALRGAACENVETALASAGVTATLPKMSAATTWFNLNFFSDPNNTPTSSSTGEELPTDAYIHVKLVMNIYTDDQTSTQEDQNQQANIKSIYAVGNQNNLKPAGGVGGTEVYAYNFFVTETEGEYAGQPAYDDSNNAKWDPTRWMVMEFDTWCPEADGTTSYTPLRIKMTGNGWVNFSTETLFIKEISLTKCTGTPSTTCYATASKTYETLKVGSDDATSINSATLTPASNGAKYSLDGKRVNNDYKGVVIENGSKTIVR